MVPSTDPFGDGREWARQVREAREGETPEFFAVDIGSLIAGSGHTRVGILKIDVEGAEDAIFRGDCSSWLGLVDDIAIEIHSPAAKAVFSDAVGRAGFKLSQHGDITMASAER
jgi:FkbM family methyltransferase